jgi:hypothetical protein
MDFLHSPHPEEPATPASRRARFEFAGISSFDAPFGRASG